MLFALALLTAQAVDLPEEPPEDTIDFFGRRRLCAELGSETDQSERERRESARLACARLPAEEREIRARYPNQPGVLGWLARDPNSFRLDRIEINVWEVPSAVRPIRIVESGTSAHEPGVPYRMGMEEGADHGRSTRLTVSFGEIPSRSFLVDNARFPWLDLHEARIHLVTRSPSYLRVEIPYGRERGYCNVLRDDDRPRIAITFGTDGVTAEYQDRTNCSSNYAPLTPSRS